MSKAQTKNALASTEWPSCPFCKDSAVSLLLCAPDRFHMRQYSYQVLKCSSCSAVWTGNPPPPEEMSLHYGQMYHEAISSAGETNLRERWEKQIRHIHQQSTGGKLLDVGCGSGAFLSALKGEPWKLYGIEYDLRQAERARNLSGGDIWAGMLFDAPFEEGSFDVITGFHVLEHLSNPVESVKRIFDFLKPGGILYLGLPNIASWEARFFGSYWFGLELPRHLYHYSPTFLRKLLSSAGFEEVWLKTAGSYSPHSLGYLLDKLSIAAGHPRAPKAAAVDASLPLKIVMKAYWLALGMPLTRIAQSACTAANIEAIFRKP